MKKMLYDALHIPYYRVMIVKQGSVVGGGIVRVSKSRAKYFRMKKYKAAFILPNRAIGDDDGEKRVNLTPIRIKSGLLLVYDVKNAFPMRLVSNDSIADEIFGVVSKEESNGIYPSGYVSAPVDSEELHDFFEAKVTEDILSDNSKDFPVWLLYIIVAAIAGAVILGALYMTTGGIIPGSEAIITTPIPTPIPTLPPGYVIQM